MAGVVYSTVHIVQSVSTVVGYRHCASVNGLIIREEEGGGGDIVKLVVVVAVNRQRRHTVSWWRKVILQHCGQLCETHYNTS